jgi:hypothetical protein
MAGSAAYEMPPDSIARLVDAPSPPSFTLDPTRRWALMVAQPALPPIEVRAVPSAAQAQLMGRPRCLCTVALCTGAVAPSLPG